MKHSPTLIVIAAGVALATLAAPVVFAETYGEAASERSQRINIVRPAASQPGSPAPAAAAISPADVATPAAGAGRFRLTAGRLIGQDLAAWGKENGWQVLWKLPRDWTAPADTDFDGDFKAAAAAVIRTLAENGLVIRATFFDGNRTLVVHGAGPLNLDPQ